MNTIHRTAALALVLAACDGGSGSDEGALGGLDAAPAGVPDGGAPPPGDAGGASGCLVPAGTDTTPEDGFRPTRCGGLLHPRTEHEAVRLLDGRVLIVGGRDAGFHFVPELELYDPATESFAEVGSLIVPRVAHQATLLPDGRVLVTGGDAPDDFQPLASTELFDPALLAIAPGPAMTIGREAHQAVALLDGRVLVAGGYTPEGSTARAEIFDPVAGAFAATSDMTTFRHQHEAVRLADGRVLVTGGADAPSCCSDGIADAEVFTPGIDRFTAVAELVAARPDHDLTALADGGALVTGGTFAHGAADGPHYVVTTETFDPASATFAATAPPPEPPGASAGATLLLDGRVLLAGGVLSRPLLYRPDARDWVPTAEPMLAPRGRHSATLLVDGSVLLVGGDPFAEPSAEIFAPGE